MSDASVAELLLLQVVLIFLNAVFACAEIAVISVNDNKLKKLAQEGNKSAARLISLTEQPAKFLATIQVGITLAGFLASAFAADNFSERVVAWLISLGVTISPAKLNVLSVIGITLILSYVTLILGELVPKRIAMQNSEKIGLAMSGLLYFIAKIFAPLVWLLTVSTNTVLRLLRIDPEEKSEPVTEEEIRIMVDAGNESGIIDDTEKKIIHNVFEFDDKTAEEVMTHRTKVIALNIDDTMENWEKAIIRTRHSVYPVYEKNHDNIIGTLSLKDYFKFKKGGKEQIIQNAVKPAKFIAGSVYIDDLFKSMQKSRNHFAVIVDEYGTVNGIVTMHDLLEELVGEFEDDSSVPPSRPMIKKINKTSWYVNGDTPIDDVCAQLKIKLPCEDYETFAGFVLSLMGSISKNKTNVKLEYKNLKIKVVHIKGYKIEDTIVKISDETN